jgi:hypothetical protein
MMGTTTYCPTNKNRQEITMVFQSIHKRCLHADDLPIAKMPNALPGRQTGPEQAHIDLN